MFKALDASGTKKTKRGDLPGGIGRRRASLFGLGAATLLALASCAAVERPGAVAVTVSIPQAVTVALPPSAIVGVAGAETAPVVPAVAASDAALSRLHGKTRAGLAGLLGKPDFVRRDPPAEIWQYRGVDCVLDLFLYPEAGEVQVIHAETRDRQTLRRAKGGCVATLMGQKRLMTTASAESRP